MTAKGAEGGHGHRGERVAWCCTLYSVLSFLSVVLSTPLQLQAGNTRQHTTLRDVCSSATLMGAQYPNSAIVSASASLRHCDPTPPSPAPAATAPRAAVSLSREAPTPRAPPAGTRRLSTNPAFAGRTPCVGVGRAGACLLWATVHGAAAVDDAAASASRRRSTERTWGMAGGGGPRNGSCIIISLALAPVPAPAPVPVVGWSRGAPPSLARTRADNDAAATVSVCDAAVLAATTVLGVAKRGLSCRTRGFRFFGFFRYASHGCL